MMDKGKFADIHTNELVLKKKRLENTHITTHTSAEEYTVKGSTSF